MCDCINRKDKFDYLIQPVGLTWIKICSESIEDNLQSIRCKMKLTDRRRAVSNACASLKVTRAICVSLYLQTLSTPSMRTNPFQQPRLNMQWKKLPSEKCVKSWKHVQRMQETYRVRTIHLTFSIVNTCMVGKEQFLTVPDWMLKELQNRRNTSEAQYSQFPQKMRRNLEGHVL